MKTLNSRGQLLELDAPKVMGIINVTTDSFYDGGIAFDTDKLLKQADRMVSEGVDILDIGGYSSRPGAEDITSDIETERVLRAIDALQARFPHIPLSIDTFRSVVAKAAIAEGAAMINDISGGDLDPEMYKTVGELGVPYILMHMRGTPKTMSELTHYDALMIDILHDLSTKISRARAAGISDIIVDPGFGFAKDRLQNFEMLSEMELFHSLEVPILIGISRKSFIYKTLGITPQEALNGTTALHMMALLKGAHILRVHDVREAKECIALYENLPSKDGH